MKWKILNKTKMKQNLTDMNNKFINKEFMEHHQINHPMTPPASPPLDSSGGSLKVGFNFFEK